MIKNILAVFRASLSLTRLVITSPWPTSVLAILGVLWFVFTSYLLIDNFSQSMIKELIDPWLKDRPHFIWTTSSCDKVPTQRIESIVKNTGLSFYIACMRTSPLVFVKPPTGD